MTASKAEISTAPRHEMGANDNWGSFRLQLNQGHFRLTDHRPAGALVQGSSSGWTTGRYVIKGDRFTFIPGAGAGDTPLGRHGDQPVASRWSLYRGALTFHLVATAADPGPPLLFVKPWRRA
jgi:hypothetical protein